MAIKAMPPSVSAQLKMRLDKTQPNLSEAPADEVIKQPMRRRKVESFKGDRTH